jgi:hypothetical protein
MTMKVLFKKRRRVDIRAQIVGFDVDKRIDVLATAFGRI